MLGMTILAGHKPRSSFEFEGSRVKATLGRGVSPFLVTLLFIDTRELGCVGHEVA